MAAENQYKNIYIVCSKSFYKNKLFDLNGPYNRDDCLYPYYALKQKFNEKGIDLNTYDYFSKQSCERYSLIFFDFPKKISYFLKNHKNADKFLIIWESPIKAPANWEVKNHKHFKKIFTWDGKMADNKKYFKLLYSLKIPSRINIETENRKKLCTAIFGHKLQSHRQELYTERIKAIRWFEKNHPEDFEFYGAGWDKYYFKDKLFYLNRIKFLSRIIKPPFYPSYRGNAPAKKDVYKNYKFAICYENAKNFQAYITDKIFDCFFSGCIPIYWGASDITDYVPENTFIDKRKFKNYEELYDFIKNMPDEKYFNYLKAIKEFVESDKIYPFSAECFTDTLVKEILN